MRVNWRGLAELVGNVGASEGVSELSPCNTLALLSVQFQLWCGKECKTLPHTNFWVLPRQNSYAGGKGPRFR